MALRSLRRGIGSVFAALAVAASLGVAGTGSAHASTSASDGGTSDGVKGGASAAVVGTATVNFIHTATGRAYSCNVYRPSAIGQNPGPRQLAWNGTTLCDFQVHMQGASAAYVWGQDIAYYPGTWFDNISTMNSTTGQVTVFPGAWGVNNNVLFFVPPDYTATPGDGCSFQSATTVHCTATSGPLIVS
ncbi:hypothetical protein [Streptomyces scopuliridis]|nr:hypothetical protein [Streptomyces scopuliridis]